MNGLKNWIPYKFEKQNGFWQLRWMDLAERHIAEPFFDETIGICLSKMSERSGYKPLSDIGFLIESAIDINAIAPTAFIFHVSRCGSTLLTQALSTDQANIVYAEAPLLDEILRAPMHDKSLTAAETEKLFKAAVKFLGQQRKSQYQQLFIKLDSWHIHFYPLLRKWFPDTPFYFLSREPNAVIVSHHKRRGLHSIPGFIEADLLKIKLGDEHYSDFNFFTAGVLEGYYRVLSDVAAADHPLNHFYDYSWGIDNLLTDFFASIGRETANVNEMKKRLSFHSKYPDQLFNGEDKIEIPTYPDANSVYNHLIAEIR
jgi:hypothetical protein